MSEAVYPVLLAGGSGTRLWPLSRELYPKQLLKLLDDQSLVQLTVSRLLRVVDPENIRVVCGKNHTDQIALHLEQIGLKPEGKILSEPCGRNTAPAILLAVLHVLKAEPDAILCVFPADHVIRDVDAFHFKLKEAIRIAQRNVIVTFGIQPDYPETGYGYIEGGEALGDGALRIKRFIEKPDLAKAKMYLKSGNFFWNSGMFVFRASVVLSEFEKQIPALYCRALTLLDNGPEISEEKYAELPSISFDYAVMEKTENAAVLPSDFGWSDIGSWKSLYDFLSKDPQGNVIEGDVIANETENCLIIGHKRLIAVNHLKDVAVVETPDSVFVSDLVESKHVRSIVEQLKASGRSEFRQHDTVFQIWGSMTALDERNRYSVTRVDIREGLECEIHCAPDTSCVLAVVDGHGRVRRQTSQESIGKGQWTMVNADETIYLKNDQNLPLTVIRIQTLMQPE